MTPLRSVHMRAPAIGRPPAMLIWASLLFVAPAYAAPASIDTRVNTLEKQMRVLQRQVFPKGAPIAPEVGPTEAPASTTLAPSVATELNERVTAVERELQQITQQTEQNGYRLRQAEQTIATLEARLAKLEGAATPPKTGGANAADTTPETGPKTGPKTGDDTPPPTSEPPSANKPSDRAARLAAIEVPVTGDATEDAYSYAYRLYAAGLYPEAQTKLKAFIAKYPSSSRTSFARNLLGRAYLDEGKPALASVAFYDNYKKLPDGARAPESLYWLGQSLMKLRKPADACNAYDELLSVYGARIDAALRDRVSKGRAAAKCAN